MKTKIYLSAAIALVFSACTTGSYVTTGFVDDIYFNPGDVPPPVVVEETYPQDAGMTTKSADRVIISEIKDNDEGSKTMNNYILDGKDAGEYVDAQLYNMDQMELEGSDTTVYYDDNEVKYVINNYYDGSDIDFGYRIHRFHRPYFYDPFYYNDWYWDSWYYPYSSLSWSMGWGWNNWGWGGYSPWYSGWYGGYYGGWYSPYSYYGWGGGWGLPYYGWNSPYYNNYWGGRYFDSEDYHYGKRRDYNTTVAGGGGAGGYSGRTSAVNSDRSSLKSTDSRNTGTTLNAADSRRSRSVSGADNGGRAIREGALSTEGTQNRTLTELRRGTTDSSTPRSRTSGTTVYRSNANTNISGAVENRSSTLSGNEVQPKSATTTRRFSGSQGQYTRPATTTRNPAVEGKETNTYTPSYNQQRTTNRSNYNVQGYSRPSTSSGNSQPVEIKSGQKQTTTYSRPSSSSASDRTYRSTSTYNRSSSSGTNSRSTYSAPSQSRSTYSAPSRSSSSSGSSYSAPSRSSSSSGSYSGGSSSGSSGSSGGGSSSRSGRR